MPFPSPVSGEGRGAEEEEHLALRLRRRAAGQVEGSTYTVSGGGAEVGSDGAVGVGFSQPFGPTCQWAGMIHIKFGP